MRPLEEEYNYYLEHQDDLVRDHAGKVLVIVGEEIVGVYSSEIEALTEESKKREPGKFLIQRCDPDTTPQVFHSRVSFS